MTPSFRAGLGVCATTLVERGTLKVGDVFTAGAAWGKCRALQDEFGNSLEEAGPSTPVRLVGWTTGADRAPRAGDALSVAVWKSNFGRPTPSTRQHYPCDCVCSMA